MAGSRRGSLPLIEIANNPLVATKRWLLFKAEIQRCEHRYDLESASPIESARLYGKTAIVRDQISLTSNRARRISQLNFEARIAAEKPRKNPWAIAIGYHSSDKECGLRDEWYLSCHLPGGVFEALRQEFLSGRSRFLSGACEVDALVNNKDSQAALAKAITWHLVLSKSGHYNIAHGRLTMFRWSLTSLEMRRHDPY